MKFITVTDRSVTSLRIPVKNQSLAGAERLKFTEVSLTLSAAARLRPLLVFTVIKGRISRIGKTIPGLTLASPGAPSGLINV